jgi:hypothetical protein
MLRNAKLHTLEARLGRMLVVLVVVAGVQAPAVVAAPMQPFVSDNAPGQNRASEYGPVDPWLYTVLRRTKPTVPVTSENSPIQNRLASQGAASNEAAAASLLPSARGFAWGDAALGAAGALGVTALAAGAAIGAMRGHRRRISW